jgi:hypothetical protein
MFPDQHVQPSYESKHIGIIIKLGETVFGMTFNFVPNVPLVESNLEGFRG